MPPTSFYDDIYILQGKYEDVESDMMEEVFTYGCKSRYYNILISRLETDFYNDLLFVENLFISHFNTSRV